MEEMISQEKIEEMIKTEGKIRGVALKIDSDFVLKEEGDEGLKRLEEELARAGYPLKYQDIKQLDFYPLGLRHVTLFLLERMFAFDDEKFAQMGEFGIKVSLLIRLSVTSFVSLKTAAKQLPKIWKMYFTKGGLEVTELDEEKRHVVLQIRDFPVSKAHAQYLRGYFSAGVRMITRSKADCKVTKATFKGDGYNEFVLTW